MRKPTRFDIGMETTSDAKTGMSSSTPWIYQSENGKYMLYAEYAVLSNLQEQTALSAFGWKELYDMLAEKKRWEAEADKQYLIAENERLISENDLLRKAVEASLEHLESGFTSEYRVVEACKAALHGGSTNPPDPA